MSIRIYGNIKTLAIDTSLDPISIDDRPQPMNNLYHFCFGRFIASPAIPQSWGNITTTTGLTTLALMSSSKTNKNLHSDCYSLTTRKYRKTVKMPQGASYSDEFSQYTSQMIRDYQTYYELLNRPIAQTNKTITPQDIWSLQSGPYYYGEPSYDLHTNEYVIGNSSKTYSTDSLKAKETENNQYVVKNSYTTNYNTKSALTKQSLGAITKGPMSSTSSTVKQAGNHNSTNINNYYTSHINAASNYTQQKMKTFEEYVKEKYNLTDVEYEVSAYSSAVPGFGWVDEVDHNSAYLKAQTVYGSNKSFELYFLLTLPKQVMHTILDVMAHNLSLQQWEAAASK